MKSESYHIPVLLNEAVSLVINEQIREHVIVDGTLGGGSYTKLLINKLNGNGKVVSVDKDMNSIERIKNDPDFNAKHVIFINDNFANIKQILEKNKIKNLSGIVLDLGLSTFQLNEEEGFSFMKNTFLDMRAYKGDKENAADILNSYNKAELTSIFRDFGEIGNADRLSQAIISRRKENKFQNTFDLVETVDNEYKIGSKNRIDFLAKIFQALRIKINNELENLESALKDSLELLIPGGRIVIVSYHSLEDRIVKTFFRDKSKKFRQGENPFFDIEVKPELKILTKKPVMPSGEEVKANPRSRSAKLRAAEKI